MKKLARRHPQLARAFAVLTVLLLVATAYLGLCRPYQLHWGATTAEIERPMAGDELNLDPSFLATRAITIEGDPEEVWHDLVCKLVRADRHVARHTVGTSRTRVAVSGTFS